MTTAQVWRKPYTDPPPATAQPLAGEIYFWHDAMGRVTYREACLPDCSVLPNRPDFFYTYDLAGNMTQLLNGVGVTFNSTYNSAGQLNGVTHTYGDANRPPTVISNITYGPPMGPTSTTFGNGLTETRAYDARGRLQSLNTLNGVGGSVYNFSLGLAANGNVVSANDSVNGNWTYGYDEFNRLAASNKNTGQQGFAYDYDRFGNRWNQRLTAGSGGIASYSFDANNRMAGGVSYDALGNVLNDGSHSYTYDAENRLIQVDGGSAATYIYDALGRRVKGPGTIYMYDINGHLMVYLSDNPVDLKSGEMYAGDWHVGSYGYTQNYLHADWLGTKRLMTGVDGSTTESFTNAPFGDNEIANGTAWNQNFFTDDVHDPETNLEHTLFRQYSSAQGRWLSPDPLGGDISDPQSLNRYGYVLDDPINTFDPLGLCSARADACGSGSNNCMINGFVANCFSMYSFGTLGQGGINSLSILAMAYQLVNSERFQRRLSEHPELLNSVLWTTDFVKEFSKLSGGKDGKELCVGRFVKQAASDLNPFSMGVTTSIAPAGEVAAKVQLRAALRYAATRTNYLGGKGLLFPLKSSVFRNKLALASRTAGAAQMIALDVALAHGLKTEYDAIRNGDCAASW